MRQRCSLAGALAADAVHAAPLSAANAARLHGCGASGARAPLSYSMPLQQAAQRYSQGCDTARRHCRRRLPRGAIGGYSSFGAHQ